VESSCRQWRGILGACFSSIQDPDHHPKVSQQATILNNMRTYPSLELHHSHGLSVVRHNRLQSRFLPILFCQHSLKYGLSQALHGLHEHGTEGKQLVERLHRYPQRVSVGEVVVDRCLHLLPRAVLFVLFAPVQCPQNGHNLVLVEQIVARACFIGENLKGIEQQRSGRVCTEVPQTHGKLAEVGVSGPIILEYGKTAGQEDIGLEGQHRLQIAQQYIARSVRLLERTEETVDGIELNSTQVDALIQHHPLEPRYVHLIICLCVGNDQSVAHFLAASEVDFNIKQIGFRLGGQINIERFLGSDTKIERSLKTGHRDRFGKNKYRGTTSTDK
jgi:hypothetical protein